MDAIFIAIAVDADVAVADNAYIGDNCDGVVGVCAGGEFLILGRRWTPHGRQFIALFPVAVRDVGGDTVSSFLV